MDYYAPRIIQIAGAYPGLTKDEYMSVQSEQAPDPGMWAYDFSDPDGPQMGTLAIEGSELVHGIKDPVVIIAEHTALSVDLPKEIVDPVDLAMVVDRGQSGFEERKFLVVDLPGEGLRIAAFNTKSEIPAGATILGHVEVVQIPWLPAMAPTKTGFMEADEYF